jgi:hypothetical protein
MLTNILVGLEGSDLAERAHPGVMSTRGSGRLSIRRGSGWDYPEVGETKDWE